jgi:hypothetical protein
MTITVTEDVEILFSVYLPSDTTAQRSYHQGESAVVRETRFKSGWGFFGFAAVKEHNALRLAELMSKP